jgi:hypothetical protein
VTVLLDDHLLRDWMTGSDVPLRDAIGGEDVATTNLWYVRLCKSASRSEPGALLGRLNSRARQAVVAGLVDLPKDVRVVNMRTLAWRMGELMSHGGGLSTLGAEAIAAAEELEARMVVSDRDLSPAMLAGCQRLGISFSIV